MTPTPTDLDEDQRVSACARRAVGPAVILVGYDHSDDSNSAHALSYAAGMATRNGARLVVVTVDESLEMSCPPNHRDCRDQVAHEVEQIVGRCTDSCDVTVETGDPAGVLARAAHDVQADVVVLGRCRHPWLHPLGSVPGWLVRHTEQPVLVVP
jgi:nucleotide-binding universal stress UspA family protein